MIVAYLLLTLIAVGFPVTACPDLGRSLPPRLFPEATADERPVPLRKEATAEAILGNCFLAGTLVSMADGTKRPIEEVRAGDRVKASNPRDGQVVDREVVRTFSNVTETVVDVTWAPLDRVECMAVGQRGRGERHSVGVARAGGESSEDGEPPSAQTVRCTPGHPWWVEGQQRWVLAGDLRVGDQLRLEDGRLGTILAVASRREVARTFNFEVEGLHTYFVATAESRASVLVHNFSSAARRALVGLWRGARGMSNRQLSHEITRLQKAGFLDEIATAKEARGIASIMYRGSVVRRSGTAYGDAIDLVMKGRVKELQGAGLLSQAVRVNRRGSAFGPDIFWSARPGIHRSGSWIDLTGASRSSIKSHIGKYPGSGEVWTRSGFIFR